jgi:hypothetical protein
MGEGGKFKANLARTRGEIAKLWLLLFENTADERLKRSVVPAKAGTHNHHRLL